MHKKSKVKPSLELSGIGSKNNTKDILSESMLSASSTRCMKIRKNKIKNKIKWADDVSIGRSF